MARFLIYTSPARGHLYPVVDTLVELHGRGHEVHVRTLASEVTALRDLALLAEPIATEIESIPLDTWRAATPQEGLSQALATFAQRARHEIPDLERAIAEIAPDAVLVDITTVGAAAVAEASSLPWAQSVPLLQQSWLWPGAPAGLVMVPFALDPAGIEVLNGPRRQLGLSAFAHPDEVWRATAYLYYTAPPFASAELDYPASFRFVGPGLREPVAAAPAWLDELEAGFVLVTASSEFQRDDALIETALTALAGTDLQVVVTTGAHAPSGFDPPSNVRLIGWLPHGPALRKASVVVCHGGMGITQKALSAGVPACVAPFGRDQFDVAHRVAELEAGTAVLPPDLSPESLRTAVRAAADLRAGAARVAAGFAAAGGAPAAADRLESLLPT